MYKQLLIPKIINPLNLTILTLNLSIYFKMKLFNKLTISEKNYFLSHINFTSQLPI